jgi:hypothetical protein
MIRSSFSVKNNGEFGLVKGDYRLAIFTHVLEYVVLIFPLTYLI